MKTAIRDACLTLLWHLGLSLLLFIALVAIVSCTQPAPPTLATPTSITPITTNDSAPFPAHLVGAGLAWTDPTPPIGDPHSGDLAPHIRQLLADRPPVMLRYPGWVHADLFHLSDTRFARAQRQLQRHPLNGTLLRPDFGIAEFLTLCRDLHATPLLTLNMHHDTPQSIATLMTWLRAHPEWPKPLWELGDTPYARHPVDAQTFLSVEDYISKMTTLATAISTFDPSAQIGVPVESPLLIHWGLTAQPSWTSRILRALPPSVTFITLQHTTWPAATAPTDPTQLYLAGIASGAWIDRDLQSLRTMWPPDQSRPILVSAYAPIFSSGFPDTDRWTSGLAGAIVTAEWLRIYAAHHEVIGAVYAALLNGRYIGTIRSDAQERPVATVFRFWHRMATGRWVPLQIDGPTYRTPSHPVPRLSPPGPHRWVNAVASQTPTALSLLVWNGHPDHWAPLELKWPMTSDTPVNIQMLTGQTWTSGPDDDHPAILQYTTRLWDNGRFMLPPHSLALIQWDTKASSPDHRTD